MWFRRDLRLADNPALAAAAGVGERVLPLFVLDPTLVDPAGAPRVAFLYRCLRDLDRALGGRLVVRTGDPAWVLPRVATEADAASVVAADFGPYGRRRDDAVEAALAGAGRRLERVGSPYAVEPGLISTGSGEPFKVFTPFFRTWKDHVHRVGDVHGCDTPVGRPPRLNERLAVDVASEAVPADPMVQAALPPVAVSTPSVRR